MKNKKIILAISIFTIGIGIIIFIYFQLNKPPEIRPSMIPSQGPQNTSGVFNLEAMQRKYSIETSTTQKIRGNLQSFISMKNFSSLTINFKESSQVFSDNIPTYIFTATNNEGQTFSVNANYQEIFIRDSNNQIVYQVTGFDN